MSESPTPLPHCPECGAEVKPLDARCWLCHRSLIAEAEVVESDTPLPSRPVPPRRANAAQFSLETLMLVITLIAVCLGIIMAAPGYGIVVAMVAAPALVRTLMAGHQERKAGKPLALGEKVLTFIASTGVALAVLVTGGTAFAAACMGSCFVAAGLGDVYPGAGWNNDLVAYFLLGVSGLVGLGTAGWMFWVLRPRRNA
ncbi:MAG: hypothetical protein L0211_19620 [Planctomycetaceae bacterium]|nr:hypothetical protein [Planctomycetaceae bacterium]